MCSNCAVAVYAPEPATTIETSWLFRELPRSDLDALTEAAEVKQVAPGELIFREGDSGDGVYFVRQGSVQISGLIGPDQREVFAHVKEGELFGEMSVLDNLPRSASAIALQQTSLYFVPRQAMLRILRKSPELSLKVVQEISKRLREFNRQHVQKVVQAERMALVGRFASSIVHDLKNPLTIIGMAADAVCHPGATPKERRAAATRINHQIERVTSMVNDILDYTRGSHTDQTLELVDYSKFILTLVTELQSEMTLKKIRIEYVNPPPAIRIAMRPKRLSRVLHNLVGNAADAMPNGGNIRLRFSTTEAEVVTTVHDSGPGIAPEVMDKLFEAFVTFGKQRGTGLGLSICQRIIEEHQGTLAAANDPNGGAVLTMRLPRIQP